jgi:hypothetical protein
MATLATVSMSVHMVTMMRGIEENVVAAEGGGVERAAIVLDALDALDIGAEADTGGIVVEEDDGRAEDDAAAEELDPAVCWNDEAGLSNTARDDPAAADGREDPAADGSEMVVAPTASARSSTSDSPSLLLSSTWADVAAFFFFLPFFFFFFVEPASSLLSLMQCSWTAERNPSRSPGVNGTAIPSWAR